MSLAPVSNLGAKMQYLIPPHLELYFYVIYIYVVLEKNNFNTMFFHGFAILKEYLYKGIKTSVVSLQHNFHFLTYLPIYCYLIQILRSNTKVAR